MRTEEYSSKLLKGMLTKQKICTMEELMKCLGVNVRMTVFRKLAELPYQTSYSHRGKFYTLKQLCKFNDLGLYSFHEVRFSIYGTLMETAKEFVERSSAGYSTEELNRILRVSTKEALLNLQKKGVLSRQKYAGVFIYFSTDDGFRRKQVLARGSGEETRREMDQDVLAHEVKAAIILFFSLLDERQRRLFAGMEVIRTGMSDAKISEFLGLDPHTVAKGRCELLNQTIGNERLRQPGGGRKKQEKKLQR